MIQAARDPYGGLHVFYDLPFENTVFHYVHWRTQGGWSEPQALFLPYRELTDQQRRDGHVRPVVGSDGTLHVMWQRYAPGQWNAPPTVLYSTRPVRRAGP